MRPPPRPPPSASISKIARAKWTGGMAQAVECLLCKCEALSSNPTKTKYKIKQKHLGIQNKFLKYRWYSNILHLYNGSCLFISLWNSVGKESKPNQLRLSIQTKLPIYWILFKARGWQSSSNGRIVECLPNKCEPWIQTTEMPKKKDRKKS
jgi:hypothetical protein